MSGFNMKVTPEIERLTENDSGRYPGGNDSSGYL